MRHRDIDALAGELTGMVERLQQTAAQLRDDQRLALREWDEVRRICEFAIDTGADVNAHALLARCQRVLAT